MKRTLDKILAFFFCVGVFTGGASFNCIIFVVATNLVTQYMIRTNEKVLAEMA